MILLEMFSWLALAAFFTAIQLYLRDDLTHALRYLGAACGAAALGGTVTRLSSINLGMLGGYSVASLFVAGVFSLSALTLLGSRSERRSQRI